MITLDQFIQLSDEEKRNRVHELSDIDVYRYRLCENVGTFIKYDDLSEEEKKKIDEAEQKYISDPGLFDREFGESIKYLDEVKAKQSTDK